MAQNVSTHIEASDQGLGYSQSIPTWECTVIALTSFSSAAFLIADPARAAMLTALLDGRALPAGELAYAAGVTAQTASTFCWLGHGRCGSIARSSGVFATFGRFCPLVLFLHGHRRIWNGRARGGKILFVQIRAQNRRFTQQKNRKNQAVGAQRCPLLYLPAKMSRQEAERL